MSPQRSRRPVGCEKASFASAVLGSAENRCCCEREFTPLSLHPKSPTALKRSEEMLRLNLSFRTCRCSCGLSSPTNLSIPLENAIPRRSMVECGRAEAKGCLMSHRVRALEMDPHSKSSVAWSRKPWRRHNAWKHLHMMMFLL